MKKRIEEADLFHLKHTMIIRYCHSWGGAFQDKKFWEGQINGEVYDWHTKETLKQKAEAMGLSWMIIRQHRNGQISVIEQSH